MRFFPPVVTGPIIICIGMTLANSAINNCADQLAAIAILAVVIVVVFNIWGKGMFKIIPILLGVVGSYVVRGASTGQRGLHPRRRSRLDRPARPVEGHRVLPLRRTVDGAPAADTAIITIMPRLRWRP